MDAGDSFNSGGAGQPTGIAGIGEDSTQDGTRTRRGAPGRPTVRVPRHNDMTWKDACP